MARDLVWSTPAANSSINVNTMFDIAGIHAIPTGPSSAFIALQFSDEATDDANDPTVGNWRVTPGAVSLQTQPQQWDRQSSDWQVQNVKIHVRGEVYVRAAVWETFSQTVPVGNPIHWSQSVRLHRGHLMDRAVQLDDDLGGAA